MLIDVILACAPAAVGFPAAVTLLTSQTNVASKGRAERRLYRTLLLAEKLPPGAAFAPQIAKDIDRQTLHVAYVAQYPRRAREIGHLALIGALAIGVLVGYYLLLAADADLLSMLIALGLFALAALWWERALLNFTRNDALARELFAHFGAPDGLVRPPTEMITKAPALSTDAVFELAADIRDANHDLAMTTLCAVNVALAQAHSHVDWRLEGSRWAQHAREVDYRAHAVVLARQALVVGRLLGRRALAWAATAYDWLLRHAVGPFFTWRVTFLDSRERQRTANAHKTGDVFQAAWLTTHYRNERQRVAQRWTQLHSARDPLLTLSGNGHHAPASNVNATTPHADLAPSDSRSA